MGMRYHTRVLEDADPNTFVAIGTEHGKDATTVYEWDIPILHADPKTFKRLTENYARETQRKSSTAEHVWKAQISPPLNAWATAGREMRMIFTRQQTPRRLRHRHLRTFVYVAGGR